MSSLQTLSFKSKLLPSRLIFRECSRATQRGFMTRALGRVRDADVRLLLLRDLEARTATVMPTLALIRQELERRRLQLLRAVIKRLESRPDCLALSRCGGARRGGGARSIVGRRGLAAA
jgi:hypothetical protein